MITDTAIKAAIAKGKRRELKEGTGKGTGRLVLRVRPVTGGRVIAEWYARQWLEGARRTTKIGTYPNTTLADARKLFAESFTPAIERKEDIRRHRRTKDGTLKELFEGYVAQLVRSGAACADDTEYCLGRALKTLDGSKAANKITADDIVEVLRPIYAAGHQPMSMKVRGMIHAAFNWGIRSENDYRIPDATKFYRLAGNPVSLTPSESVRPRKRWLDVPELRPYWEWLNGEATQRRHHTYIEPTNIAVLKLHVVVGQRVQEICRIHDTYYDRKRKLIQWPETKNGRAHVLPLPAQAVSILDSIEPNKHGWFFPGIKYPDRPIKRLSPYAVQQRYVSDKKAEHFCPRDIRRTWKTLAAFAKISKEDRDLLQNHARSDVSSKHYDQYEYLDEKRAAMKVWEMWFAENIESENVLPLRKKRA